MTVPKTIQIGWPLEIFWPKNRNLHCPQCWTAKVWNGVGPPFNSSKTDTLNFTASDSSSDQVVQIKIWFWFKNKQKALLQIMHWWPKSTAEDWLCRSTWASPRTTTMLMLRLRPLLVGSVLITYCPYKETLPALGHPANNYWCYVARTVQRIAVGLKRVSRHFGPETLRTQDTSASWRRVRNVQTLRHRCRSVHRTLRHRCRTVCLQLGKL